MAPQRLPTVVTSSGWHVASSTSRPLQPGVRNSLHPAQLWAFYLQLVEVEQAFKELKNDLAVRPIYHQADARIEAHIFVAFLAYCLQVTLK
jgi:transposase